MGSSLKILKDSGDNFFGKIYKMQIPKSGNAMGSSLDGLKDSRQQLRESINKVSTVMDSSIKAFQKSGRQIISVLPKISKSNHAMGTSLKTMKNSGKEIFDKISNAAKP